MSKLHTYINRGVVMTRKSKIFKIKTYDSKTIKELEGIGLYYAFGYDSTMTGYRILVFNPENYNYRILLKPDAAQILVYYDNESIDIKEEKKHIKQLNEKYSWELK